MNAKTAGSPGPGSPDEFSASRSAGFDALKPGTQTLTSFETVVVDSSDRLATICGKIDATHSSDIALDVSHGNSELNTEVGMRLLMRHAERTGKTIVLVTRRQTIRQVARAEGQAFVGDMRQVRFDRKTPVLLRFFDLPLPNVTTISWLCGCLVAVAVAAAVVFAVLPSATITIFPPVTAVSQDALLSLNSVANRVDASSAVVPASRKTIDVTSTITLPVSGSAIQDQTAGDPIRVPAIDSDDITKAKGIASAVLASEASSALGRQYGPEWRFFPETAVVDKVTVETDRPAGAKAPVFAVTYRGSVSMMGARNGDIRALLGSQLQKGDEPNSKLVESSVHLTIVKSGPFDASADRLPVVVHMDASMAPDLNLDSVRRAVEGKSRRQAIAIAEQSTTAMHPPLLRLAPNWAPWLPRIGSRISIEVAAAQ
jgi:hypothetical protein